MRLSMPTVSPTVSSIVNAGATRSVTCMAKKKGIRRIITLECTEARETGASPSRYTTQVRRSAISRRTDFVSRDPASSSSRGSPPSLPASLVGVVQRVSCDVGSVGG